MADDNRRGQVHLDCMAQSFGLVQGPLSDLVDGLGCIYVLKMEWPDAIGVSGDLEEVADGWIQGPLDDLSYSEEGFFQS